MAIILRTIVLDWTAQTEEEFCKTNRLLITLAATCVNKWLARTGQVLQEKALNAFGIVQTLDGIVDSLQENCKAIADGIDSLETRPFIKLNGWELNIRLKNGYIQPFLIQSDRDEEFHRIQTLFKVMLGKDNNTPLTLVEQERLRTEVPQTVGVIVFANRET